MSGFEVAGIVLGVLPLFVEAGKAYSQSSFQKATSRSARDEKLVTFYENFWWEIFELRKQIEKIVEDLPALSDERKHSIIHTRDLDNWDKASDIADALTAFFASEDDYLAFQKVMSKVLSLLSRLVKDETVNLSKFEMDHTAMYQKLKKFQEERESGGTYSSFRERFRFFKKDKDRDTCLKNLRTWNKRLNIIVDSACKAAGRRKMAVPSPQQPQKSSTSQLRTLSQKLFKALWKCWSCACKDGHEARFCLASCCKPDDDPAAIPAGISFDFLFSHSLHDSPWREAYVMIKKASSKSSQHHVELQQICDAIIRASDAEHCIQLLVEDLELAPKMWQLNWRQAQFTGIDGTVTVSMQTLLAHYGPPSLLERRRLVLTFAYSLLQLHESPWLSEQWDKDRIHFFHNSSTAGAPDIGRPYVDATFNQFPSSGEPAQLERFHRNAGIFKLGVLLIEVHTWKPLESFWTEDDRQTPTPNTDLLVARRVLTTLHDCFPTYRGAIEACLGTSWVQIGSRVSLEDSETRDGLYNGVIKPLEMEVALGAVP